MQYLRFLTNSDYCSLLTEEHMKQIVRDMPQRIPQAEQRAEMNMLEYLDQYYEIEKVLSVGKNIREHSYLISYPGQVYIRHNEEIFKTLCRINGCKKPTAKVYWVQILDLITPCMMDRVRKYSQLHTYAQSDIVQFGTEYWECQIPHGYESGNIHIPGVEAWTEVEATPWEPNLEWEQYRVCSHDGKFYMYLSETSDASENVITPDEDENWGLIGDYSDEFQYEYGQESHDYVVAEDKVFVARINPNADELQEGVNIMREDPRNPNVIAHMCRIAVYYLHQLISPTNISETRKWAYDESMLWLYNASKFKINPQIPRKRDRDDHYPKVDWALATFQKDYDPYENAWLI